MAETKQPRDIFRFFDLPAEMREAIYDESFKDIKRDIWNSGLEFQATDFPRSNLLLVSKEFKQEYEARANKRRKVLLKDTYQDDIEALSFALPNSVASCPRISVEIIFMPGFEEDEMEHHLKWLEKLSKYPGEPNLQVRVTSGNVISCEQHIRGLCKELIRMFANVDKIVAYDATFYENESGEECLKDCTPRMKWSHEKQKLEELSEEEVKQLTHK